MIVNNDSADEPVTVWIVNDNEPVWIDILCGLLRNLRGLLI